MEDLVEKLQCSVEVHLDPARRLLNRLAVVIGAPPETKPMKCIHTRFKDCAEEGFMISLTRFERLVMTGHPKE